jgi:hypothetical protein
MQDDRTATAMAVGTRDLREGKTAKRIWGARRKTQNHIKFRKSIDTSKPKSSVLIGFGNFVLY